MTTSKEQNSGKKNDILWKHILNVNQIDLTKEFQIIDAADIKQSKLNPRAKKCYGSRNPSGY